MAQVTETPATPELPMTFPLWAREPAKIVGWIVATLIAITGAVGFLAVQYGDLVPKKYEDRFKAFVGIATAVGVIATRVQSWMTRNGIGKPGNGKDGVWSPAAVAINAKVVAAQASTPEAIEAAINPKLLPPTDG